MNLIEQVKKGVTTTSPEATEAQAEALTKVIPQNQVLALHGDLGTGKTTFVKGLAQGWNIQEVVTSPTYHFFTIYQGDLNLIHLDAYRIEGEPALDNLLLEDFITPPYCLVVEWPEKLGSFIPQDTWHFYLKILKKGVHQISLKTP